MIGFLPSAVILGTVVMIAWWFAARSAWQVDAAGRRRASWLLATATAIQAFHFAEETATGFHERFPALFDLPAIPLSMFIGFNGTWLVIWIFAVAGLRVGSRSALFAAWFLGLAAVLNLVAHPLLALRVGGYFPGLWTSPFIGLGGLALIVELRRITRRA